MRSPLKEILSAILSRGRAGRDRAVVDLFRENARRYPDRPAVRCEGREWSYRHVDEVSDLVAAGIVQHAPPRETGTVAPVGVVTAHDEEAVVGILAALKAGLPFVHLSTDDPPERRRIVAEAAAIELVVRGSGTAEATGIPGSPDRAATIAIPPMDSAPANPSPPAPSPLPEPSMESDLGIVFTSGQTGTPLGVRRSQRSQIEHVRYLVERCGIGPGDRIGMVIPFSFGAGLNDVFLALLSGACLCPFPFAREGIPRLLEWLEADAVTYLHLVPSVLRSVLRQDPPAGRFPALRWLKVGGEPFTGSDLRQFRENLGGGKKILLSYGTTETGGSIVARVLDSDAPDFDASDSDGPLSVGKPLPGKAVEIVDASGLPVKEGELGEIVVTGATLASGYFRDPERTAERFLAVEGSPGSRRFSTRDLGKWDENGNLCHLGRLDGQVKVHGIRVDPAGIESLLRDFPGIEEAAVIRESRGGRLVAFLTSSPEHSGPLDVTGLRTHLGARVARGVVPHSFRLLDTLPRSANGKIDRKRLGEIARDPAGHTTASSRIEPRDPLEETVAAIWARVLDRDRVGIYDDFFEMGGDSLAAVTFQAELSRRLGLEVPVAVLLGEHPTVAHVIEQLRHYYRLCPRPEDPIEFLERPCPSMVPIRREGDRAPVLFLPGGFGSEAEMMLFARLSPFLDPGHPVFGFRATTLYQQDDPPGSIAEAAALYLEEAREVIDGHRPFLVGNCVAGMVAFEMARQLAETSGGERLPHLVLIESASRRGWRRRREKGRSATRDDSNLPGFARFYYDLFEGHVPGRFGGPVDLMIGEGFHDEDDPTLGWKDHVEGPIEIHRIEGDHFDAVRRHRDKLGRQLQRLIASRER